MTWSIPQRESRNEERKHFQDHDRIVLLEQDQDRADRRQQEILNELRGVKAALYGVVVTAASATIVGAINLAIGGISV